MGKEIKEVMELIEIGKKQGWSMNNIIMQVMYKIASEEELQLLELTDDIPMLKIRAKGLYFIYDKYKKYNCEELL